MNSQAGEFIHTSFVHHAHLPLPSIRRAVFLAAAMLLVCGEAPAQQAGLRGFVTDASDRAPLQGVHVVLVQESAVLGAVTNADGDGTFTGVLSGIAYDENGAARAGMGVDAGVVDTTGEVTIFVGNFSGETVGAYRNSGTGLFIDRAAASQIGYPTLPTLTFGLFLLTIWWARRMLL